MKQILNNKSRLNFSKNNKLAWLLFSLGIASWIVLFYLYATRENCTNDTIEKETALKKPVISQVKKPPENDLQTQKNEKIDKENELKCLLPKTIVSNEKKSDLSFKEWLAAFKEEALSNGISKATITTAFKNVSPIQKVINLDRSQKEYSVTFSKYLTNSISTDRISRGKSMLKKHAKLLKKFEKKYGVQPQVLVALWAMESNFGDNMGNFSTINTLATLAHDGRRHRFFRNELFCALHILEEKHISANNMKSSWAGAMGQPQFMPSTFFHYGIDGDGDRKKDIWSNETDVLASAANYLKKAGWEAEKNWGLEVILPENFDPYNARLSKEKILNEWYSLGVTKANGQALPNDLTVKGSIILPSGIEGPAFLVFENFGIIRKWNNSINYALAVGHLSDRLLGYGRLVGKAPKGEKPLSRVQAISLQENLEKLGLYNDKIDGMVGLNSRNAIREYQKDNGIPADGYPSPDLMSKVKKDAMGVPSFRQDE